MTFKNKKLKTSNCKRLFEQELEQVPSNNPLTQLKTELKRIFEKEPKIINEMEQLKGT